MLATSTGQTTLCFQVYLSMKHPLQHLLILTGTSCFTHAKPNSSPQTGQRFPQTEALRACEEGRFCCHQVAQHDSPCKCSLRLFFGLYVKSDLHIQAYVVFTQAMIGQHGRANVVALWKVLDVLEKGLGIFKPGTDAHTVSDSLRSRSAILLISCRKRRSSATIAYFRSGKSENASTSLQETRFRMKSVN